MNGADAVFGACGDTPGAVTVEDSGDPNGPITARSITFEEDGYSLVGATADDTLSLAADGTTIDVEGSNATATIRCKLVDAAMADETLTKDGEGTLILANDETYTGNTDIEAGTAQLGDGTTNGTLSGNVVDNGKLRFAEAVDYIFGGNISGNGSVTAANDAAATLTLSGTRSYTRGTTLESGGLAIPGVTIISTLDQLQNLPFTWWGHFLLVKDIDASATADWNDGVGFAPVSLASEFDGGGHVISNLTINRPDNECVGLFDYAYSPANIHDLGLVNANVFGQYAVGALVGHNYGTIANVYSTGAATTIGNGGTSQTNPNCWGAVGGLVGYNSGTILRSYSAANVTEVVGPSDSSLGNGAEVGGLVGFSDAGSTIRDSYATGNVSGVGDVGGLVGIAYGDAITIDNCFASGNVSGGFYIGGLVGLVNGAVQITDSFASGSTADWGNSSGFFVGQIWGTGAMFANDYYLRGRASPTRPRRACRAPRRRNWRARPLPCIRAARHGTSIRPGRWSMGCRS